MKRPRHRLVLLTLGPAIALAVVATVVAQERRFDRGDTTRDDTTRGDSTRGDSSRGDSSRGDSTRGDRGDRGAGRGRFERRSPTTLPGPNGQTASSGPTTSPAWAGTTQPSAVAAGSGLPEQYAILARRSIFVRDRSRL